MHSLISMIGETAATPTSVAGAHGAVLARQLQREVPAERIAGDRDCRQPVDLRSTRAPRARRRRSAPSETALPPDAPYRRSCAGSGARHSGRVRTLSRRGRACSARRSIRSGRAARRASCAPTAAPASDNRRQPACPARHRSSGASAPAAGEIPRVPPAVQRHVVTISQEIARHETVHPSILHALQSPHPGGLSCAFPDC